MKKSQQIWLSLGGILSIGILVLGSVKIAESNKKMVFRLAEVHDEYYPTSMANKRFADLVEEKTEGRIRIEVYTNGVLGEETDVIREMQEGNIDFGRVSVGPLAEYVDRLYALMLPYLYEDSEHMWRVLDSALGSEMLEALDEANLIGLAWYDSGARSFYLKEKIVDQEGFNNKKIRVQKNSLMYALCEVLGAKPQFLAESVIYLSLLEGSLDGAENNILTYETYKQYEVSRYYILDEHTRIPDMLVASKAIMEKFSKEDQEIILEAAREAGAYERILWNEREQESISRLKEKGVQFVTLSEEVKASLRKACESLYDEFGSKYQTIIDQIEEMADAID